MSDGSGGQHGSDFPPDDTQELVRDEARRVIQEQLQTLRDTDQKALATARINGLILGVLASAASISSSPSELINIWMILGSGMLLLSLCVSIFTYTVDRPDYGIGPGYIDEILSEEDNERTVRDDLLSSYADWIEHNSSEITTNSTYLFVAQTVFVGGLTSLGYGILGSI